LNRNAPGSRLTLKQRLFVAEYLVDLNARRAATRAGYWLIGSGIVTEYLRRRRASDL
jgi:hypothetical protein